VNQLNPVYPQKQLINDFNAIQLQMQHNKGMGGISATNQVVDISNSNSKH